MPSDSHRKLQANQWLAWQMADSVRRPVKTAISASIFSQGRMSVSPAADTLIAVIRKKVRSRGNRS